MSEPLSKRRGLPLRVKMRHEAHFVEELTARHETPVGQMVPLSAIEPNPDQPRSAMGDLSDLGPPGSPVALVYPEPARFGVGFGDSLWFFTAPRHRVFRGE